MVQQVNKEGFFALSFQVEREWRRKERQEAIRKIKEEEELNAARCKQIEDQRRAYAFEIQREKEETEKIAKLNIEYIEKSKETDNKSKMVNNCYETLILFYKFIVMDRNRKFEYKNIKYV